MTKDEALALALEALAASEFHLVEVGKCGNGLHKQTVKAITAIKQAQQSDSTKKVKPRKQAIYLTPSQEAMISANEMDDPRVKLITK